MRLESILQILSHNHAKKLPDRRIQSDGDKQVMLPFQNQKGNAEQFLYPRH